MSLNDTERTVPGTMRLGDGEIQVSSDSSISKLLYPHTYQVSSSLNLCFVERMLASSSSISGFSLKIILESGTSNVPSSHTRVHSELWLVAPFLHSKFRSAIK